MSEVITKTANATPAPAKMPVDKPEPPKASPQTAAIINSAEAKEDAERAAKKSPQSDKRRSRTN